MLSLCIRVTRIVWLARERCCWQLLERSYLVMLFVRIVPVSETSVYEVECLTRKRTPFRISTLSRSLPLAAARPTVLCTIEMPLGHGNS